MTLAQLVIFMFPVIVTLTITLDIQSKGERNHNGFVTLIMLNFKHILIGFHMVGYLRILESLNETPKRFFPKFQLLRF